VDVDEKLIEHILMSATEQGIVSVEGVLGEYDDPSLPEDVDVAFINDVLHHIEHRDVYLKNLAGYLKPTSRVAIIDYKPGQGGHADDPKLQVSQEQATVWMAAAGLKPVETVSDVFTDRWFVIYGR
jgi:2-polyprenyl-3-methyl-5-hydroxy-6-metoxy-1,4-benzoquinol methylase